MNDVNVTGPVLFNTTTRFRDGKLTLRNPANTFTYTINTGAIGADRSLVLPAITGTDTLAVLGLAQTFTAAQSVAAKLDAQKDFYLSGDISPTQLTADQNDYNPTNLSTSSVVMLDADSSFRTITGLQTGADGRILIVHNMSANTILLANQNTNSSAANRFDFGGYDIPLFPSSQVTLFYDNVNSRWKLDSSGSNLVIPSSNLGIRLYHDFWLGAAGSANPSSDCALVNIVASGGAVQNVTGIAKHPGISQWTMGTSTTGTGAHIVNGTNVLLFGNSCYTRFDCIFNIDTLSNATDNYTLRIGFIDSNSGDGIDGAFIRYNHGVNSGKFQSVTRNNTTETANDTTVTASAGTWVRITIIVNPAGTNVDFYFDGTLKVSNTTNIPTGAGRATGFGMNFIKTAGTTSNNLVELDAIEVLQYFNTSR